ncbi:hypothetical protein M422DRAFT_274259 [Sphaerobolus stellatus SS14]|uniref:Uncharacterized protein n=1 Tax=Sphaerobolus stellatus (strain SS14) TaxID=990650 RepID=A0A0C9UI46_SPHS4|nr:hypothetical protein M422DRAFT_274259 [Sphaerobolus stellatus SS14]
MPLVSFRRRVQGGKQTSSQPQTDWLDNAAFIAKLASATGELLPSPYLKGAAALVSTLLEPIQQMQQNKEDYQALTISVTNLLQALHEEISEDLQEGSCSEHLEKQCVRLHSCLQRISGEIHEMIQTTNASGYRRFLTTGRIKARLTDYEKEIDGLWKTFMLRCSIKSQMVPKFLSGNTRGHLLQFRNVLLGDVEVLEVISGTNDSSEYCRVRLHGEKRARMARIYKGPTAQQLAATEEAIRHIAHNLVAPNCFVADIDVHVPKPSIRYLNTLDGYSFEPYVNIADSKVEWSHDLQIDLPTSNHGYNFVDHPGQIIKRGWSIEEALSMTQQVELDIPASVGCTTQELLWAFYEMTGIEVWKDINICSTGLSKAQDTCFSMDILSQFAVAIITPRSIGNGLH